MAGFRDRDKQYFPLKNIEDVVDLFKGQLDNEKQPDLTLLSIVIGAVEACLTINRTLTKVGNQEGNCATHFPAIPLHSIEALYERFVVYVKGSVDLTKYDGKYATRNFVKKASDVVWNSLARSYHKDKAHLQSIYSFLTGNKLDCFGVAFATVAACQQLGYHDVHLALSEDHAWVVYGEDGDETAEVTWHGKGLEDRRGLPISEGVAEKSWLYLNGHPVICTRQMEVASIVSAINPAISSNMDSVEMTQLQQKLLWLLYDRGHLNRYPQALGNLGELEDVTPSGCTPSPLQLFTKSTEVARQYYNDSHVYPYTYLGSFHYRKGNHRQAIYNWAQAAKAISQYNHNREDEEIYKEFLEVANESIPNIVKVAAEELHRAHLIPPSNTPLLQDSEVYSHLLQFYDGICQWEEGSSTPVLHVGWAQHLVHSLSKFEEDARAHVLVERGEDSSDSDDDSDKEMEPHRKLRKENMFEQYSYNRSRKDSTSERQDSGLKRGRGRPPKSSTLSRNNNNVKGVGVKEHSAVNGFGQFDVPSPTVVTTDLPLVDSEDTALLEHDSQEEQIKSAIEELVSRVGSQLHGTTTNPNLAALAQACGESILNPEFLITGGEPFTMPPEADELLKGAVSPQPDSPFDQEVVGGKESMDPTISKSDHHERKSSTGDEAQIVPEHVEVASSPHTMDQDAVPSDESVENQKDSASKVQLQLHSAKMRGLRSILVARKLNSNAIKLQLTAQSQVHLKNSITGISGESRKRSLRQK